jgi:hypothetical protein
LQALQKQALVELVPGLEHQHWRMAAKYRLSRKIIEVGGLVGRGEWTTYGDISQVVYGHAKGGLAVGRVAAAFGARIANGEFEQLQKDIFLTTQRMDPSRRCSTRRSPTGLGHSLTRCSTGAGTSSGRAM